jgi:mannosyltransferase
VFYLILGLFIAARLWRLTAYSVRADEIFSIQVAGHDWLDLLRYVIRDIVHPPLFYMLLKIWLSIGGESERWLRLFPVLTAVAAICPFVLLCRKLKLKAPEINLAFMLIAVNGYLIYFAQELRMYSLLLFLTVTSLWLFARFFNAPGTIASRLIGLFVINLLLVYTQYYGWFVVAGEFLILLLWQRHKLPWFLLSVAGLIICFAPWAYKVTRAAIGLGGLESNIGSFARPKLEDLGELYASVNGPLGGTWQSTSAKILLALGQILFAYPVLLWAWQIWKREADERSSTRFWLLFLFSILPVACSFLISQVTPQSIWGGRFFINAAVPYMILVSLAIFRLHPKWLRNATLLLVIAWASLSGFQEVNHTDKRDWEPLVYRMIRAENSHDKNIMIYAFGSSDETIMFYLQKVNEGRFRTKRIWTLGNFAGDHFWVASRSKEESPQQFLRDKGYRVGDGYADGFGALLSPVWWR